MNIFYLDDSAVKCAMYLNDKHVVKMIVEYAQILSTAHRVLDGVEMITYTPRKKTNWRLMNVAKDIILYKATHIHHPCTKWAMESFDNYTRLLVMLRRLLSEYTFRYGKVHKVEEQLLMWLIDAPMNISNKHFTMPPIVVDEDCIVGNDVIASYRKYYIEKKAHIATWKNRPVPDWYVKGE